MEAQDPPQTQTQTADFVRHTYDRLGYLDLYGNSVIIVLVATLVCVAAWAFAAAMQARAELADDWVAQRCKPQNLPFAGWIYHPEGTTPLQYTRDNFQFCTQSILKQVAGYSLQPLQYSVQSLSVLYGAMADSMQATRATSDVLRTGVAGVAEGVMQRVLNITAPLQQMLVAVMDTFQKIQGVAAASLYTMLGSYLTLQALMGAVMDMIVKVLIALSILIAGLWMVPFTWPAAASMTAVFLGISVPMALILRFMRETLHIQGGASLPRAPKKPKLRCFAGDNLVQTARGLVRMDALRVGDELPLDGRVTCVLHISGRDLPMYDLGGVCCSGTHPVRLGDAWVRVADHPAAVPLSRDETVVFCANTERKTLHLGPHVFRDWDEMDVDVHRGGRVCLGFPAETTWVCGAGGAHVRISDVEIDDLLSDGQRVMGVVHLAAGGGRPRMHLLTDSGTVPLWDGLDARETAVGDFDAAAEAAEARLRDSP